MSLDPAWLFVSMVANAVGVGLFIYGKKQARLPQLFGGLALIIYPYFVGTLAGLLLAGGAICGAVYWAVRAGY
jgi:hypothetical protein